MKIKCLPEEESLVLLAVKQGDLKVFEGLFHKYYPTLCAYAHRFVDIADAEEVAQDVFVSFWEKREELLINTSLNAYLFKMVYHRVVNKLVKEDAIRRADEHFCEEMKEMFCDTEPYQFEELQERIEKAIASLPATYREAFVLYRLQGMDCKEVAARLGVSDKTVYYRVQQAIKLLQEDLKDCLPFAMLLLVSWPFPLSH